MSTEVRGFGFHCVHSFASGGAPRRMGKGWSEASRRETPWPAVRICPS